MDKKWLPSTVINNGWYYSKLLNADGINNSKLPNLCSLYHDFPLHAEIEATCIAIEGMMEVKDDTRRT